MTNYELARNGRETIQFTGDYVAQVDDRQWLGATQNWWTLTLYRAEGGSFVLASLFHMNRPRFKILKGAVRLTQLADVYDYLVHGCGGPAPIADALIYRAKRQLRYMDNPPPPIVLTPPPDAPEAAENLSD